VKNRYTLWLGISVFRGAWMRRFIFTDRDRRLLEAWILGEEETQDLRKLLSQIRKGWPLLSGDVGLLFRAIDAMMRRERWRERMTRGSELGSASLCAESALTRARRGGAT